MSNNCAHYAFRLRIKTYPGSSPDQFDACGMLDLKTMEGVMTNPQAILIAVAVIAAAFLVSEGINAGNPSPSGQVAITSVSGRSLGAQAFVARGDGQVRFCLGVPMPEAAVPTSDLTDEQLADRIHQRILRQQKKDPGIAPVSLFVRCSKWK